MKKSKIIKFLSVFMVILILACIPLSVFAVYGVQKNGVDEFYKNVDNYVWAEYMCKSEFNSSGQLIYENGFEPTESPIIHDLNFRDNNQERAIWRLRLWRDNSHTNYVEMNAGSQFLLSFETINRTDIQLLTRYSVWVNGYGWFTSNCFYREETPVESGIYEASTICVNYYDICNYFNIENGTNVYINCICLDVKPKYVGSSVMLDLLSMYCSCRTFCEPSSSSGSSSVDGWHGIDTDFTSSFGSTIGPILNGIRDIFNYFTTGDGIISQIWNINNDINNWMKVHGIDINNIIKNIWNVNNDINNWMKDHGIDINNIVQGIWDVNKDINNWMIDHGFDFSTVFTGIWDTNKNIYDFFNGKDFFDVFHSLNPFNWVPSVNLSIKNAVIEYFKTNFFPLKNKLLDKIPILAQLQSFVTVVLSSDLGGVTPSVGFFYHDVELSFVDFSFYLPYKPIGDLLITVMSYGLFAFRTLKRIPSLIRG